MFYRQMHKVLKPGLLVAVEAAQVLLLTTEHPAGAAQPA